MYHRNLFKLLGCLVIFGVFSPAQGADLLVPSKTEDNIYSEQDYIYFGDLVDRNIEHLHEMMRSGNPRLEAAVALAYFQGLFLPQNPHRALTWALRSWKSKEPWASATLSLIRVDGKPVLTDQYDELVREAIAIGVENNIPFAYSGLIVQIADDGGSQQEVLQALRAGVDAGNMMAMDQFLAILPADQRTSMLSEPINGQVLSILSFPTASSVSGLAGIQTAQDKSQRIAAAATALYGAILDQDLLLPVLDAIKKFSPEDQTNILELANVKLEQAAAQSSGSVHNALLWCQNNAGQEHRLIVNDKCIANAQIAHVACESLHSIAGNYQNLYDDCRQYVYLSQLGLSAPYRPR